MVFADHAGSFDRGLLVDFNRVRRSYWSGARRQWMARVPADVRKGSFVVHTGDRVGRMGWLSMPTRDLTWLMHWTKPNQGTRLVVGTPKHLRDKL